MVTCPILVPAGSVLVLFLSCPTTTQLLAVKDGIGRMLERVDLTDEERAVLEGDREVLGSLAERLVDVPTPAGPTPREMGTAGSFIPLTNLLA
jgi:hypothetical protein